MSLPSTRFPYGVSVNWFSTAEASALPTSNLTSWLLDNGSLTEKLKARCKEFTVIVLGEAKLAPLPNEYDSNAPLWVREVLLCLEGEPWVFARTLMPLELLTQTQVDLKGLGNRPLGELLFSHHAFIAGQIQIGQIDSQSLPKFGSKISANKHLWGRRRFFAYQQHQMIVSEFFLPAAQHYIENENS
ncbi:MAG: chorismate--pyruvate lyase family protein [Parashewanella sp.]